MPQGDLIPKNLFFFVSLSLSEGDLIIQELGKDIWPTAFSISLLTSSFFISHCTVDRKFWLLFGHYVHEGHSRSSLILLLCLSSFAGSPSKMSTLPRAHALKKTGRLPAPD